MIIESGGKLMHSPRLLAGLGLKAKMLQVQLNGVIDLNGKGLNGGVAPQGAGETYDVNDSIVAGASGAPNWGAGASYGGLGWNGYGGAVTNPIYGDPANPRHLGSGGGAGGAGGASGGGRVRIVATTCVVDGTIRANGLEGQY